MFLPIRLKESSRVRLCKILVGIESLCVILAKLLSHHGFRYRKDFRLYTSLVEGYDAGALPLMLIATGIATSLANLFGIYVSFRSMYPSLRQKMMSQMDIYIKLVLGAVVLLIVCCFFCFRQQSLISDSFKNGIMSALTRYRTEPQIKEDIDELQVKFQCCGNEKYTDWFQVSWISEEYVDVNLPEEQKKTRNGFYETDDVPFSCCNPDAKRPCVHTNVHDNLKNFNYVYQKDLTIFKDGCRTVLVQKADYLVAFIFSVATILIFLEISIAVLCRHFVTSVAAALELGDPTAATDGFLLSAGLLSRGKAKKDGEEAERDNNNSAAASSSPSFASSSTTLADSLTVSHPSPTPPSPPAPIPLPPPHRRLPLMPPQPPPHPPPRPSPSQAVRRPVRRPSHQAVHSPTRRDYIPMQLQASAAGGGGVNDSTYIDQVDPRVNRSRSFYDQSLRRMP